jgi:hypothetical protein
MSASISRQIMPLRARQSTLLLMFVAAAVAAAGAGAPSGAPVLAASSAAAPVAQSAPPAPRACAHFARGHCKYGARCRDTHAADGASGGTAAVAAATAAAAAATTTAAKDEAAAPGVAAREPLLSAYEFGVRWLASRAAMAAASGTPVGRPASDGQNTAPPPACKFFGPGLCKDGAKCKNAHAIRGAPQVAGGFGGSGGGGVATHSEGPTSLSVRAAAAAAAAAAVVVAATATAKSTAPSARIPPPPAVVARASHRRVCKVYAATGRCKFGSRCRNAHDAASSAADVPLGEEPAATAAEAAAAVGAALSAVENLLAGVRGAAASAPAPRRPVRESAAEAVAAPTERAPIPLAVGAPARHRRICKMYAATGR